VAVDEIARRTDEDRAEFEAIRATEEFAAGHPDAIASNMN